MIVVLSSGFPFGGEPFLNIEYDYMPESVIFFSEKPAREKPYDKVKNKSFKLPSNSYFNYGLKAVKGFFDSNIREEIALMKKRGKYSRNNLKQLYMTYGYSMYIADYINDEIKKMKIPAEEITFYSYWMASHAVICARLKELNPASKFISRAHSYDLYEFRFSGNYIPLRKYIFDRADRILPISRNGEKYLKDNYPFLSEDKIRLSFLGTLDKGKGEASKDGVFRIVSCSNLEALKRVDRIIEIISHLKVKTEWTHYGDGAIREELEKKAEALLNKENIKYTFRGYTPNQEIMEDYRNNPCDLFINVSTIEGLPVSVMEAMSFGIPSIATDVGGTSEIVSDQVNGYLINSDFKNEEVAKIIVDYINKSDVEKEIMRNNARKTWEEDFNADANFKKFYADLEKMKEDK